MPNDDILVMQTPDGKRWDVPRSQVSAMTQRFGAKPYVAPGPIQRGLTSFAGIPEETDINPLSSGFYAGAGSLGNYIQAVKSAITGLNPLPSMAEAEKTAETRFKQPGWANKVTGAEEFLESGVPYAGPGAVRSHEQFGAGDIAGGVGSAASAGFVGSGLAKTAPALAERLTPTAVNEMARRRVAGLFDVGENFEERVKKEHQEALDTINREYEQKVQQEGQKTSESEAAYRMKVEQLRDNYARKIAANEAKKLDVSAKETGAEVKKKALSTQPRSGPVYQRLAGMADQIATQDVPKLDKDVRAAQDNRWTAFRQAIGDDPANPKMVDWTPVQNAVTDAEANILQGSPESIAIFRNIVREGVNPALEKATIFQRAGTQIGDILASKNLTEQGRANLLAQLGEESQFEQRGGSGPTPDKNIQIPFEDARGYYTELGQKLASRSLPGDVRRALKSVQDAVDTKAIRPSIPKDQLGTYNQLKSDWAQYMSDFYHSDGPLSQLKHAATSDGRLNLLTGSKGSNIIEALGRYSRFNPNVTGMAGRLRSLMKQLRELPSSAPPVPGRLPPPHFPRQPKAAELSARPTEVEPLDLVREKLLALEKMPKTWGSLRPYQAVIPYYWPRLAAQKAIAELLSHPLVREWIAGAK